MKRALSIVTCIAALAAGPAAADTLTPKTPTVPQLPPKITGPLIPPGISFVSIDPKAIVSRRSDARYFDVRMTLQGLPAGARVRIYTESGFPFSQMRDAQARLTAACHWIPAGDFQTTFPVNNLGSVTVTLKAAFHKAGDADPPPGFTGPCDGVLPFQLIPASGTTTFQTLLMPPQTVAPLTTYRIDNTWALRNLIKFQMQTEKGGSTCSGISIGPASFPVGPHEVGGDIALDVRSGPVGTVCRAVANYAPIDKALRLTAIDWQVSKTGDQCDIGDKRLPDGVNPDGGSILKGAIASLRADDYCCTLSPDQNVLQFFRVQAPARPADKVLLQLMHVRMACRATAVNDHGVRVTLRSVTFEGAPGLSIQ